MTTPIAITLVVLAGILTAIVFLSLAPERVLMTGLILLLALGVLTPEDALLGFANDGLITIAALFIVMDGLRRTGATNVLGSRLLGNPSSVAVGQRRIMVVTSLLSAVLNNTPVVAMMVPIVNEWARKHRLAVSRLLLPLSYAALLGGMLTLVGTSTTLVVNGLLIAEGHRGGLGMFEIAWVGAPLLVLGTLLVLATARLLLPARESPISKSEDPREYTFEMIVEPGSPLAGKTIGEAGLRNLGGTFLMEIERDGEIMAAVAPSARLREHDRLVFVGVVDSVLELKRISGLKPATDQVFKLDAPTPDRCLIEAVVSYSFPFLGRTIRDARFRSHYNAAVIAVARNGARIPGKIGDIELQAGDTLLLETHPNFVDHNRDSRDFFLISRIEGSEPPRLERAWLARIVIALMVILVATGSLSILKASLLAAVAMVALGCCRGAEIARAIDLSVVIAIGAGLGVGKAMAVSGAALWIGEGMIAALGSFGSDPVVLLAAIYGLTMVFTNIITGKAAAVLMFPIAVAVSTQLSVALMPFAIAVVIASAASFATPVASQTNLIVFGPGGYRAHDFLRLGLPLSALAWLLTVLIVPRVWGF